MTPQVNTQPTTPTVTLFVAPLLNRIKKESAKEFGEMQQAFELLGWELLPDEIKIEIYDDVRFMVQELKGLFSTNNQHVHRRRETVHFWVQSYFDGICSKQAALKALKIKAL
jgi:hypothetical protein